METVRSLYEIISRAIDEHAFWVVGHGHRGLDKAEYDRFEQRRKRARKNAKAAIAALHEAGYAIVPREPNRAMIVAGNSCTFPVVVEIYRAMLTAAAGKEETGNG